MNIEVVVRLVKRFQLKMKLELKLSAELFTSKTEPSSSWLDSIRNIDRLSSPAHLPVESHRQPSRSPFSAYPVRQSDGFPAKHRRKQKNSRCHESEREGSVFGGSCSERSWRFLLFYKIAGR